MPNRILKDSICTSDTIDKLTAEEERFFYRLIVQCDDYGRLDARPSILISKIFPLRIKTTSEQEICFLLAKLIEVNLINIFIVNGKPYLQVVTWNNHQQIRAKKSKYPQHDPNENHLITPENICYQLISLAGEIIGNHVIANAPVIQSNPIQSNPIPEKLLLSKVEGDTHEVDKPLLSIGGVPEREKTEEPQDEIEKKMSEIVKIYTEEISPNFQGSVAEQLKEIARQYPLDWFRDACGIAAKANHRRLDYVMGIITRWNNEGRVPKSMPVLKQPEKVNKNTDIKYWPNVR